MSPETQAAMLARHDARLDGHDREIGEVKAKVSEIGVDIKEISENLSKRPSWAVSIVMAALVGAICTLSMHIIKDKDPTPTKARVQRTLLTER